MGALSDTGPIEILTSPQRRRPRERPPEDETLDHALPRKHTRSEMVAMIDDRIREALGPEAGETVMGKISTVTKAAAEDAKRDDAADADPAKQIGEAVGAAVATALAAFMSGGGGGKQGRHTMPAALLLAAALLGSPLIEQWVSSDTLERIESKLDQQDRTLNGLSQYTWDLQRCAKGEIPCPTQPPASVRIAAAEAEQDTSK